MAHIGLVTLLVGDDDAAGGSACSCTPTTSAGTTSACAPPGSGSPSRPGTSPTARSRSSKTSTAIAGTWSSHP